MHRPTPGQPPRLVRQLACIIVLTMALFPTPAGAGEILARVQAKGVVRCGVSEGVLGFSLRDASGRWIGFNADFCRAVAAAALGDPERVTFAPMTASARFPALLSGEIDLLLHNTTWTLGREAGLGVHFAGTLYYDGQAFMVSRKSGVRRVADLNGATICVIQKTTTEVHLADYFKTRGWTYRPLVSVALAEATGAFFTGRCRSYTSDRSQLAAVRMGAPGGPDGYVILPELISKEPLGPVVRRGDEMWLTLVKWVLFALLETEERGITRQNVRAKMGTAGDPALAQFLGTSEELGKALGTRPDWVVRIVEAVGNYGEMFERNLGGQSPLKLERGLNRLWTQGGLMYAPPFR